MNHETINPHQPLFGEGRQLAVSFHNVGDLLRDATPEFKDAITQRYSQRSGANDYSAQKLGAIGEMTPPLQQHAAYLSAVYNKPFKIYTFRDLTRIAETKNQPPLAVPYINTEPVKQRLESTGAETWGLPPAIIDALKDKESFHRIVESAAIEGLEVPEYKIAHKTNFVEQGIRILQEADELYRKYDLQAQYPRGLVIRLAESDGNYGNVFLRQKNNHVVLVPDGNSDKAQSFNSWEEALRVSRDSIYQNTSPTDRDPHVVISRLIDLKDTPGMSLIIKDGKVQTLGWNGQLQADGSLACIGTSMYTPDDPYLQRIQRNYEESSTAAFTQLLKKTAVNLNIPFDSVTGIANIDLMIPGTLENTLRQRQGKPFTLYGAECNMRFTNFTDAVMAGVGVSEKPPTIKAMQEVIAGGIHTLDKYQLPKNVKPEVVREIIFDRDQQAKSRGDARVIVRMSTRPLGVILLGDKVQALNSLDTSIRQATPKLHHYKA